MPEGLCSHPYYAAAAIAAGLAVQLSASAAADLTSAVVPASSVVGAALIGVFDCLSGRSNLAALLRFPHLKCLFVCYQGACRFGCDYSCTLYYPFSPHTRDMPVPFCSFCYPFSEVQDLSHLCYGISRKLTTLLLLLLYVAAVIAAAAATAAAAFC